MKKIDVKSLQDNVFSLIGDRWMLITAGTAAQLVPPCAQSTALRCAASGNSARMRRIFSAALWR